MFTGRLPHELGVKWLTPLTADFPTLAEYLGSHGYATAGFIANTQYCSSDTGLDRGFTHYEDYVADLIHLRPLRFAVLFEAGWNGFSALGRYLSVRWPAGRFHDRIESCLKWLLGGHRKDAAEVNGEFLEWLARRREPRRPFFAFLNYFDAHAPYILPEGTPLRFGRGPRTLEDFALLVRDWKVIDKRRLSPTYQELVRDSYDNCLGHLDDCLGSLLSHTPAARRARSDLGDRHGRSRRRTGRARPLRARREPLPPGDPRAARLRPARRTAPSPEAVSEVVSLRDLPATIVDLVGLSAGAPFPGRSMAEAVARPADGRRSRRRRERWCGLRAARSRIRPSPAWVSPLRPADR